MKVKIIKKVAFSDCEGTVLKEYEIGSVVEAKGKYQSPDGDYGYYITSMGGIYFDEAVEVVEDPHQ